MLPEKTETNGVRTAGAISLKGAVKSVIMAKRLSDLTKEINGDPEEEELIVPEAVETLWGIVAERDDVQNREIYTALETAKKYFSSPSARDFINNNLHKIAHHLLSTSPKNLSVERDRYGQSEFDVVEKSIRFALVLIVKDLDSRINNNKHSNNNKLLSTTKCTTLSALDIILNPKNVYYQENPSEVRMDKLFVFQRIKGFYYLGEYLNVVAMANMGTFPDWEVIHRSCRAAYEGMNCCRGNRPLQIKFRNEIESITQGVIKHLTKMDVQTLEEEDLFKLEIILNDTKTALHLVEAVDSTAFVRYCHFEMNMIVKLLSTRREKHKQFGQGMLYTLIETVYGIRPLVKTYRVYDAGFDFANGRYDLAPSRRDKEGYLIPGMDVCYEKIDKVSGKKMIISLDKSSNDGKGNGTWCLSEEHEVDDDPGAMLEYSDYYTASGSFKYPPLDNWETTEGSELPNPTLKPQTELVPVRGTHTSVREELARWLIEKKVLNLVFGLDLCFKNDSSTMSEIASALELYRDGSNALSDKMANLSVCIVPPLKSSALTTTPKPHPSSVIAEIEAAQARLTSAEQWETLALENLEDAQDALAIAETKYQSAVKAADVARKYLESLNSRIQSNIESKGSFESNGLLDSVSIASTDTFKSASTSSLLSSSHKYRPKRRKSVGWY